MNQRIAIFAFLSGLTVSLMTGAIIYKLKSNLDKVNQQLEIANTSLSLLEVEFNNLNSKVQDMNTIQGVIYEAGEHYKVDPLLLTAIIKSESNFRPYPKHKLKHVVGISGINVKEHLEVLTNNPYSLKGNIRASAEILSSYNTDGNLTKTVAKYKGYNKEGLAQAKLVIEDYKRLKNEY